MNQRQRDVIDYLREENYVLREQLGERRLRFTDDQRYREFLEFQSSAMRERRIRREMVRWGIAVAVLAMALLAVYVRRDVIFGSKRPQNAELAYVPRCRSPKFRPRVRH
jgi:hypothetical protein